MCDFIQTCRKAPTISIEQIDSITDPIERNRLIAERTAEENQRTNGHYYLFCMSRDISDIAPHATFQSFLSNLTWEYHYPDDIDKRSPIELTVLEFDRARNVTTDSKNAPGIDLIGRLQLNVYIEELHRHDASRDLHKAINRVGCFDITMKTASLAYVDLRPEERKSDVAKSMTPYPLLTFKESERFQVVWLAKNGAGRFNGMNLLCFVPEILTPYDGFLPDDILDICRKTSDSLYLGAQPNGQLYVANKGGVL